MTADKDLTKIVALRQMAKMIRDRAIAEGDTVTANASIDDISKELEKVLIKDGFITGKLKDDRQ